MMNQAVIVGSVSLSVFLVSRALILHCKPISGSFGVLGVIVLGLLAIGLLLPNPQDEESVIEPGVKTMMKKPKQVTFRNPIIDGTGMDVRKNTAQSLRTVPSRVIPGCYK